MASKHQRNSLAIPSSPSNESNQPLVNSGPTGLDLPLTVLFLVSIGLLDTMNYVYSKTHDEIHTVQTMMGRNFKFFLFFIFIAVLFSSSNALSEPEVDNTNVQHLSRAGTANDPAIPLDELKVRLIPLTSEALFIEANAWFKQLEKTIHELSKEKLEVKKENLVLEAESDSPASAGNNDDTETTNTALADKDRTLEKIAEIREHRTVLIDRLEAVLDEITRKIGLGDEGKEKEEVLIYRRYIESVGGIHVDVSDTKTARSTIVNWLTSKEGGIRWAKHIRNFLLAVLGFWLIGILVSKAVEKALKLTTNTSVIMKKFIVVMLRRVIIFIGVLIGLSAMEVNTAPVLAIIGATGFVVAFALQDTLSNFASGLMIMFYKPFDVDDIVDVSGVVGKVKSMTLVTTTIMTPDNKLMVVPNNSIWGNIITNVTGSRVRRVDLVFGIGYEADIDKAQHVLEEILANHPLVLHEPEPNVRLHELADSSVNFICRPWVKTDDYWTVYWEVTRNVKERFDAEGISIPFPQRDLHVYKHDVE